MDGAAVVYMVDGSQPYEPESQVEIAMLRWTGQPCMGLVNPFGSRAHVDAWVRALRGHFNVVCEFDPMRANLGMKEKLLRALCGLHPAWRATLENLATGLYKQHEKRLEESLAMCAQLLCELCEFKVDEQYATKSEAEHAVPRLEGKYRSELKARESKTRSSLLKRYHYRNLVVAKDELNLSWPIESSIKAPGLFGEQHTATVGPMKSPDFRGWCWRGL